MYFLNYSLFGFLQLFLYVLQASFKLPIVFLWCSYIVSLQCVVFFTPIVIGQLPWNYTMYLTFLLPSPPFIFENSPL
jgi:hypothetical protein